MHAFTLGVGGLLATFAMQRYCINQEILNYDMWPLGVWRPHEVGLTLGASYHYARKGVEPVGDYIALQVGKAKLRAMEFKARRHSSTSE